MNKTTQEVKARLKNNTDKDDIAIGDKYLRMEECLTKIAKGMIPRYPKQEPWWMAQEVLEYDPMSDE